MKTIDKITRAKIAVVYDQPFFATLLMRKKFVSDKNVKSMVTTGETIRYNDDWVEGLSPDKLKGVICKSALHTAFLHHLRRGSRDEAQWKKAADKVVAGILRQNKLELPEDIYDPQYDGMAVENAYAEMGKKPDDDGQGQGDGDQQGDDSQPGDDPGGCGTVEDAPPETDVQVEEAKAKQELSQAIMVGKQAGKMPLGADVLMEILEPKVPWEEIIARFCTMAARNDYSFSKPNKRYLQSGIVMPSLFSLEVGEIVLFADTSISMDKEKLDRCGTEMHSIASMFNAHMTVGYIDEEWQGAQEFEPTDEFILEPKGGGGTDFRPGFEWLKEQGMIPKCLVYLTDGECWDFPEEEPDFPVLWAITGGMKFEPPFGEVIYID